jgi:hypothetical protein
MTTEKENQYVRYREEDLQKRRKRQHQIADEQRKKKKKAEGITAKELFSLFN